MIHLRETCPDRTIRSFKRQYMNRKPTPPGYVIRSYTQAEHQADYRKGLKRLGICLIISGGVFVWGLWLMKCSMELPPGISQTTWEQGFRILGSGACGILFSSILWWLTKDELNNKVWVICWHDQIVGYLQLSPKAGAYVLTIILVYPKHRRRGLGRALIHQASQDLQKEIYVRCAKGLISFYIRCGFVHFSKVRVPAPLSRYMFVLPKPMS